VQLASALAYVHGLRVIHRDLKTANVFLTEEDGPRGGLNVRLGDFGISRLLSS
jgi:serine/threonine protein kinase